jgi:hypothetical protein
VGVSYFSSVKTGSKDESKPNEENDIFIESRCKSTDKIKKVYLGPFLK